MRSLVTLVLLALTWLATASHVPARHTPTRTTDAIHATQVYTWSRSGRGFSMTGPTTVAGSLDYEVAEPITASGAMLYDAPKPYFTPHVTRIHMPPPGDIPTEVKHHQLANLSDFVDRAAVTEMVSLKNNASYCDKKSGHFNDTICRYKQCISKFRKPITITTVFPAAIYSQRHCISADWFTRRTTLTKDHWGVTQQGGIYYPSTLIVQTNTAGKEYAAASITVPPQDRGRGVEYQDPVKCWNRGTCCHQCLNWAKEYHGFWDWRNVSNWRTAGPITLYGALLLLPAAGVALCCYCCCRSPRRKAKKIGEKPSETTEEVATTTETTDTAGQGTLGRRAEEGRGGQVRFADTPAEAAGAAGPQVFTTHAGETVVTAPAHAAEYVTEEAPKVTEKVVSVPAEAAEHVETVAAHDGTAEAVNTGSEMADMGSMRGRKRTRQSRGDLLNLRF